MNDPKEKLELDFQYLSESLTKAWNIAEDLRKKNVEMAKFIVSLTVEDYRGNRPQHSVDAYKLLKKLGYIK